MWSDQVDIGLCTSGCLDAEQSPNTVFGWLCLLVGDSRAERPLCFVNTETPALFSFFSVLMERGSQVLESDTTLPGKLYVGQDTADFGLCLYTVCHLYELSLIHI